MTNRRRSDPCGGGGGGGGVLGSAAKRVRGAVPDQGLSVDELEDVSGHVKLRNAQTGQKLSPQQAAVEEQ